MIRPPHPRARPRRCGGAGASVVRLLLLLSACERGPRPPPAELPDAVCTEANSGQTVAVSGFLAMPELLFGCADDCALTIASSGGSHEGMVATFSVGRGPDQVEAVATDGDLLATGARPTAASAIHVHPDRGSQLLGIGDPVRVSGQLWMSHDLGRTTCIMTVDTIETSTAAAHGPIPRANSMVVVDLDPSFARSNAIIIHRIARTDLLAAGLASRFVERETGNFFSEGSLRRGDLDTPPPAWWPDPLSGAWTSGVAECRRQPDARSCAHDLHTALWDQWLEAQHAARYVYITGAGGEAFVPGEPTKRVIDLPASTTETREAQLGKLVEQLARGEGREVERRLRSKPAEPAPGPASGTDHPLYIGP